MKEVSGILLALLVSGLTDLRYVTAEDSYNEGGSCYDCQYAPYGLATTERGSWHVNNYSGFHRCALEQEDDAFYVNKWSCTSERCFIRKDPNGQVFRGCADQWNLPWGIDTSSNCSRQGQSGSIWWFCDGHLCNDGFLHEDTRCGEGAAEPPKQDPETLLSYNTAPYYAPQHQGAVGNQQQAEIFYPHQYEGDDSAISTTAITPSVDTESTGPYSMETPNQGSPDEKVEYVFDEETVHGVGFYDNFQEVEDIKFLKPQPVYQDDPKNMPQASGTDPAWGGFVDDKAALESHVKTDNYPTKHPGKIHDYHDRVKPPHSLRYDGGGIQPSKSLPPVYNPKSIPPLNHERRTYDYGSIKPPSTKPLNYDNVGIRPSHHLPRLHSKADIQPPKPPLLNDHRYTPPSNKPRIYDHGGLYPTNAKPKVFDDNGVHSQAALKRGISVKLSPHSTEPFWMWWWHSGAFQRMTPQKAYTHYLKKNAEAIGLSNRVSIGGGHSTSKDLKLKTLRQRMRQRYPPWYPHRRQYDYSPIQSNHYYSRITSKRTPSRPVSHRKQQPAHPSKYSPSSRPVTSDFQEDVSKRYGKRPIRTVKTIDPLDYKSFKPPHTHDIVEPLGPPPGSFQHKVNSDFKQSETNQDDHHVKKTKALSKKAFYDYYDSFKLDEKSRVRGHISSKDEYNPCTHTCFDTHGTLHADPLRHDRFIQCGPGSRHGEACKCCQPFYHICPEGTSFDSLHNVCSQAGSSTIEEAKYKTLELEY